MLIVADTNTFLAVALCEPERDALVRAVAGHELAAPEVLPYEIGNALTAMVRKHTLDSAHVFAAWREIQKIPVSLRRVDMDSALKIAVEHRIYAYDAYFLECAIRTRAPLLTLDRALIRVASALSVPIVELPK